MPYQGAHVFLFFENGNIMQPRYFATAPGIPKEPANPNMGFYDPDGVFPLKEFLGSPDWDSNDEYKDSLYPNAFVLSDKAGNKIILDSTPGYEKIIIEQGTSKARIILDAEGKISKDSGKGTDETYTGSQKINVNGDINEIITGDKNISSTNFGETVLSNKKSMISGSLDETVLGMINKKAGEISYDVENNVELKVAGNTIINTSNTVKIKSQLDIIKLEAIIKNIELLANLGDISNASINFRAIASSAAELKGSLSTTVGGGISTDVKGTVTSINGSALVQISGGVIMIG